MNRGFVVALVLSSALTLGASVAVGQTAVYVPLGKWTGSGSDAYGRWESARQHLTIARVDDARPQLPGLRSRNTELLLDAFQRKSLRINRTPAQILSGVPRRAEHTVGLNQLHGYMNEALAIDRNPWRYEANASDPHIDAWDEHGRSVQIKFQRDGDVQTYRRRMLDDWQADRFAVPDDHVAPLKTYLRTQAEQLTAQGDLAGSSRAWRDYRRVCGTGATSSQVKAGVLQAQREARAQSTATYVSLGGAVALAIGPTLWDWANGNLAANQAWYRTGRALGLLGVGVGTDLALRSIKQGVLRGTLRGNVIVATVVTIADVTLLVYEHGWSRAFYSPQFYESVGGSVGGVALGMIGSGAAAALVPGPGWVVGGATIVAGTVAGTVGYVGGRAATHTIIEMVAPEILQQQEQEQLRSVREGIRQRIAEAQRLALN